MVVLKMNMIHRCRMRRMNMRDDVIGTSVIYTAFRRMYNGGPDL